MLGNERKHATSQHTPSPRQKVAPEDSVPLIVPLDSPPGIPAFVPATGLANGHLQTLFGSLFPGRTRFPATIQRTLRVADDDYIVLHDDQPDAWKRGDNTVLLLHGLSGCYGSGYMMRTARNLNARRVRTFRMDHRGCGAGHGLAESPYHAGRTDDLHRAIASVERLCPGSPISVAGFSISGNLLLRYLGDETYNHTLNLFRAVAVCPPIDLSHSVQNLSNTRAGQRYDWHFTRRLINQIADGPQWREDAPLAKAKRLPRRLYDFDDLFTAPASGFESADDYYSHASAKGYISSIRTHTTILAAQDDPMVAPEPFLDLALPPYVTLYLTEHGGHLGYIGRLGTDPDRRWMDWRVTDWLLD